MLDFDYFRAIHGTTGIETRRDADIVEISQHILVGLEESIGTPDGSLRNGTPQDFFFQMSDAYYKSVIVAMPGEDLCEGDLLTINGQHWLVVNVRLSNPVQRTGLAWLCNHLFRWQDWHGVIHDCWGVLDAGVYSTTVTSDYVVSSTNKQYKVYLPHTDETETLVIDKRIAISKRYDIDGNEILDVYRVTAYDPTSSSYGPDAHLLIAFLASDQFKESTDNVELMICDYNPDANAYKCETSVPALKISGKLSLRVGRTNTYSADVADPQNIVWGITPSADCCTVVFNNDGSVDVTAKNDTAFVGETILIEAIDASGEHNHASIEVEVVAFG